MNSSQRVVAEKLQHHVIYVSDLVRSKDFYEKLFDLQFSALNHPDSSAAMRLANMEMRFFSFGYYHHDICLVKHRKLKMDNGSMLHFSLVARDRERFETIRDRAPQMRIEVHEGRLLPSAKQRPGARAFWFRDPDGHCIEVLEELAQ
jgi:predicted enzyme related to lactoylglutathione lyase